MREFGRNRFVLGIIIGFGLLAFCSTAVAQHSQAYWGDDACNMCHSDKYDSYSNHGHPWKLLQTGGTDPTGANNPYPAFWGPINLPPLPVVAGSTNPSPQVSWSDIAYILGDSKNNEAGASYVYTNGYTDSPGRAGDPTPKKSYSCGSCHTTGYSSTGHQQGLAGMTGTWALDGIQCERCHGAKTAMTVPTSASLCAGCHTGSSTDPSLPTTMAGTGLPFAAAAPYVFTGHHPQGDDFSHSPHKAQTCWICHDPHSSVWHDDGGVLYSYAEGPGFMCKQCHTERIFGPMGYADSGVECVSCHMPDVSEGGVGSAHIFRIAKTPAQQLMTASAGPNANTHTTGSGTTAKTWWNVALKDDAASGMKSGDSFLTLDLACASCHTGMSTTALANSAPYRHRPSGMLDLTIDGTDQIQSLLTSDVVKVAFSVYAKTQARDYTNVKADWYVTCNGPKGTSYWTGSKWTTVKTALHKSYPINNVSNQIVLNAKLAAGMYTYAVSIYPVDKSQVAPVAVTLWVN